MSGRTDGDRVKVAVIGAGRWGRLHAEKWAANPGVRLVAVVDPQKRRAVDVAGMHQGVSGLEALDDLPGSVEAASVAVPIHHLDTVTHALLKQGIHVLAEKPLAASLHAAQGVHEAAKRQGVRLAVGFLERFNPALSAIRHRPRTLVCHRVGPRCAHGAEWLLDWLVHDIDLARHLFAEPLEFHKIRYHAHGVALSLHTASGRQARLYAGRARRTQRRLWADGAMHNLMSGGDPLAAELSRFGALIRGGEVGCLALSDAAVEVMAIVEAARRVTRAA